MRVLHKTRLKKSAEYRRLKKSLQTFVQLHPDEGRRFLQAERELESDLQAGTLGEPNSLPLGPNRHDALQLVEADKAEHAHRSVGRLLRAGTEYRFEEASRAVCVESYKALLGRFFPESGLPSFGGRLFLAGVLANMLQRSVTLTDIATWFHKPSNQSLEVHEDLKILLWQNGLSWPPLAENMSQCGAYRLTLFKNVSSPDFMKLDYLPFDLNSELTFMSGCPEIDMLGDLEMSEEERVAPASDVAMVF